MTSRRIKLYRLGFEYPYILVFAVGWLLVPLAFGRIIGDALRVYVAFYVYMAAWLLCLSIYWASARSIAKIKRSLPLVIIIIFLCLALPVWIFVRWDKERLIYHAAHHNHPLILRILLARSANQNEINQALLNSAAGGNANIVQYALLRGASPDARIGNGDSPLMLATQSGSVEAVKLLLKQGTYINAHNNSGRTALIWAVYENEPEIAQLLIDAGADVNARDEKGETALELAQGFKNEELVLILKKG
jgi:ankyrin repeat protein